jgi:hypothetical protein
LDLIARSRRNRPGDAGRDIDYQAWFDNQRRLRALIAELEILSQEIADADRRWDRHPPRQAGRANSQDRDPSFP